MQTNDLISVDEFCANNDIEISFINSLGENGLIKIITISEACYIGETELPQLEKCIRFYYEMDINIEGIEAITHLLRRVELQQEELRMLRNRLLLYETDL
jgi:chaperone modulatory protein CbpM